MAGWHDSMRVVVVAVVLRLKLTERISSVNDYHYYVDYDHHHQFIHSYWANVSFFLSFCLLSLAVGQKWVENYKATSDSYDCIECMMLLVLFTSSHSNICVAKTESWW